MSSYVESTLSDAGEIIGDGKAVVLKPETWDGKQFPLLGYINIGDRLKEGKWMVVLWHHDCRRCNEIMPHLQRIARNLDAQHVALVEVPPYAAPGRMPSSKGINVVYGQLTDALVWFAETPVVFILQNKAIVRTTRLDSDLTGI